MSLNLKNFKKHFLFLFFFFLNHLITWGFENANGAYPNPNFKANEIVKIQLSAMKQNDPSNHGIEITFRFASPKNKIQTGPLSRFISLLKNTTYKHLLNHKDSTFLDLQKNGSQAIQDVIITTSKGLIKGFRFFLSLQKVEKFKNCWMTDAVIPFNVLDT